MKPHHRFVKGDRVRVVAGGWQGEVGTVVWVKYYDLTFDDYEVQLDNPHFGSPRLFSENRIVALDAVSELGDLVR